MSLHLFSGPRRDATRLARHLGAQTHREIMVKALSELTRLPDKDLTLEKLFEQNGHDPSIKHLYDNHADYRKLTVKKIIADIEQKYLQKSDGVYSRRVKMDAQKEEEQINEAIRRSLQENQENPGMFETMIEYQQQGDIYLTAPDDTRVIFEVFNVPADGNCFFHCVDLVMTGKITDFSVSSRRGLVVKYIIEHRDQFEGFVLGESQTWEQYLEEMQSIHPVADGNQARWAGEPEIFAMQKVLSEDEFETESLALIILERDPNSRSSYVTRNCSHLEGSDAKWFAFLLYTGDHYKALRLKRPLLPEDNGTKRFVVSRDCLPPQFISYFNQNCHFTSPPEDPRGKGLFKKTGSTCNPDAIFTPR